MSLGLTQSEIFILRSYMVSYNKNKMLMRTYSINIEIKIKNRILLFNIKELIKIKWHEVREMYPNQFVKFEIVEYHEDEKTKYVDEVAVIKAIKDGREAMKEFTKCKNDQLVYSTENESVVIEKVKHIGVRRSI